MTKHISYHCDLCQFHASHREIGDLQEFETAMGDKLEVCAYCRDQIVKRVIEFRGRATFVLKPYCECTPVGCEKCRL